MVLGQDYYIDYKVLTIKHGGGSVQIQCMGLCEFKRCGRESTFRWHERDLGEFFGLWHVGAEQVVGHNREHCFLS